MKTSLQWWEEIKTDEHQLNAWLLKQHYGEKTAYTRITELQNRVPDRKSKQILNLIAEQELTHSEWIEGLLTTRNFIPIATHSERYWKETLNDSLTLTELFAVAAHAEGMRLERINAIANDKTAPPDIREVFVKILKDETFHEKAFKALAGEIAYEAARGNHEKGLASLGLVI